MITEQISLDPIIHESGLLEMCGDRWLNTGSPFKTCDVCNDTRVIPSIGDCPACLTPSPKP